MRHACTGVNAVLDRAWEGGFALTITSQPWRPKLALQLTLPPPGATLATLSHGSLHAAHLTGVSLIAAEQPGVSLGRHIGAQLEFRGAWRGATAHCAEACVAAAVAPVNAAAAHVHDAAAHVHGGVLLWRVSPVVWSAKALVTLHTAEAVTLLRLAHATLVQHSGLQLTVRPVMTSPLVPWPPPASSWCDSSSPPTWQVQLDESPDEHGGFVVEMETAGGRALSAYTAYTSCNSSLGGGGGDGSGGSIDGGAQGGGGRDGHSHGGGGGGHSNGHSNGGQAARLDALDGTSRLASVSAPTSLSLAPTLGGGARVGPLEGPSGQSGALIVLLVVLAASAMLRWTLRARGGGREPGGGRALPRGAHTLLPSADDSFDAGVGGART